MSTQRHILRTALLICALAFFGASVRAQTNSISYQGRFTDTTVAQPTNGTYQMQFALFDAAAGGSQIGSTITDTSVQVAKGVFTVSLDFGANSFAGTSRFLEISVFNPTTSAFINLTPRQAITSAPYAIRSQTAATADNAMQLGGVPASQYVQSNDTHLSDARTPTVGSPNYIQNTTTPQAASNFNILGNGTAGGTLSGNVVNAATQFNLGGQRILSSAGSENLFAGVGAGAASAASGGNSFFGAQAGIANTTGPGNSFFGSGAGFRNTTGRINAFFGRGTGYQNTTGESNAFFGTFAGSNNTTGNNNTFVGHAAGLTNAAGFNNTLLGSDANVVNDGLSYATAIGAGAVVSASNTIQLGSRGETVRTSGPLSLERNRLLVKDSTDVNHAISYDAGADGLLFDAYTGFVWRRTNGNLTQMTLNNNGRLYARGGFNGRCVGTFFGDGYCNQDLAETFRTKEPTEAGDVVTLIPQDHERPTVRRSLRAYDEHLIGVVSSNPGLVFDEGDTKLAGANDHYITKEKTVVAAVGRVPVKFTLENGAINVGDPLTSSATEPGKAMKATGAGKIIGLALESSAKAKDGPTKDKLLMWLQVSDRAPAAPQAELQAIQSQLNRVTSENTALKAEMNAIISRQAKQDGLQQQLEELKAQLAALAAQLQQSKAADHQ